MRLIIVGCRGAGKSSLAKEISVKYGYELLDYGNPLKSDCDESIYSNYIASRKKYIQYTVSTIQNVSSSRIIQARGPETLYTYSVFAPYLFGYDWDIKNTLDEDFKLLKEYYSDYVIMLDHSADTIEKRCQQDGKKRKNMDFWKSLWFDYERPFFECFDNLITLNDPELSVQENALMLSEIFKEKYDIEL